MRLDLREDLRHAVDVRLAADEAETRMRERFGDKMLTAAEPDFESRRVNGHVEQRAQVRRCWNIQVDRELRQQLRDQVGLVQAKLVALAPSEERAVRARRNNHVFEPVPGLRPRCATGTPPSFQTGI